MTNKYQSGVAKEYKAKAELERAGFIVLRTAGSHGFSDLIAIHTERREVKFIQVKVTKTPLSFAHELDDLALIAPPGKWDVSAELWVWGVGGKDWARKHTAN